MNKLFFNKSLIINNIQKFKSETSDLTNLKLVFPVKACTNEIILEIFHNEGFGFDVSNTNELKCVSKFKGFKSFVGPQSMEIKSKIDNSIIYYDQIDDYSNSNIDENNKGIRINFNSDKFLGFSHFGVDYNLIDKETIKQIKNIHFHFGNEKSHKFLKNIFKKIEIILKECESIVSIDIGGGYEDVEDKMFIEFLKRINSRLTNRQLLVLECGDLWFKNSGILHTKVLNIKEIANNTYIVYLGASKDCNLKWSSPQYMEKHTNLELKQKKYYFYGSSCYEKDFICKAITNDKIEIGQTVEFKNISHYSVEWNTSFNGINKAEVIYE